MAPRSGPVLLLAFALTAGWACDRPCQFDVDCPTSQGFTTCEEGACVTIQLEPPATCEVSTDCVGGRTCLDDTCVFAPSCQIFDDATVGLEVQCGGIETSVPAILNTANCASSVSFAGSTLNIGPVPIDVSSTLSPISCGEGGFDATTGAMALSGCQVDGETCDLAVVVRANTQACFVDSSLCECTPTGLGVGVCDL